MNRNLRSRALLTSLVLAATALAGAPISSSAVAGDSQHEAQAGAQKPLDKVPLTITDRHNGRHDFTVEVARTEKQKEAGESSRQSIAENTGMLFLFSPPEAAAMWMRDTAPSLDIVFIGTDGRIQAITEKTVPFSERRLVGQGDSAAVLEVAAGTMEKNNIVVGDLVSSKALPVAH
ncbi:DUF192 domain-containing protein [Asaia bogorensis]|uniref:DUF192 domain-containing protein n=1 Tax=Asaia bogorensis TaxID=91915 RepID=UPI000EFC4E61|nr:DUF192 domain-containing protein [Asaia bogorensis]